MRWLKWIFPVASVMWLKRYGLILVTLAALYAQQPRGIPHDQPNPEYPGQKNWCSNHNLPAAHRCGCARAVDCHRETAPDQTEMGGNDGKHARCRAGYCKADHCHCVAVCTS